LKKLNPTTRRSKMKNQFWKDNEATKKPTRVATKATVISLEDLPKLYTVKDVADYFGVVPWTVYQWKSSGELKATKVGRSVRFTAQQVADFKAKREYVSA
jgi:excisionase family DNA binding protein